MSNAKRIMRISNAAKEHRANWAIAKVLVDGQWHRTMELKEKIKISSATLAKHLDWMEKHQLIERKEDIESGQYPVPVYRKATSGFVTFIEASMETRKFANSIEMMLDEANDPLIILDAINILNQECFISILEQIQQNEKITNGEINFLADCFLWEPYKQFTSKLIQASRRKIKDINIKQSLIDQPKRLKNVAERAIKINERIKQRQNHDVTQADDT